MRKPVLLLGMVLAASRVVGSQQLARTAYYDYLPPAPRIVAQTTASARLRLFGDVQDSLYRDIDPIDGIDDRRAARLLLIAERFSPVMRRNNFVVPRDLDATLGPVHYLHVDTWHRGRLVRSDSLALGATRVGPRLAGVTRNDSVVAAPPVDDRTSLRRLIDELHPRTGRRAIEHAEGEDEQILYFDQPGSDPASWRRAFASTDPREGARVFAHPFIREVEDSGDNDERYLFVIQFWFFYPFNDAVNTHEADWEHINVLVTTKERAARAHPATFRNALLSAADIERILSPSYSVDDSLIISAVDYFFHQNTTTLDYVALATSDRSASVSRSDAHYVWEDIDFVADVVRDRLTTGGGRIATHPIVYIGGDNKGPDELLILRPRFLASFKRNSGSSYPFPGVWQTVAGFGVTEKVNGRAVPSLRGADTVPWFEALDRREYVAFRARDIILLPDWERVEQLVRDRPDVGHEWSWLLLPIYWGYPVMRSTGAGLLKHVDMGNVAPMGPTFQSAWNRVGADPDYTLYELRVLRTPISPTTPWAVLHNGWGVLNLPLAAWGLMPGYNVALVEIMPWVGGTMNFFGAPPPRTYSPNRLPSRFTTAGQGTFIEFGGRAFTGALPRRDSAIAATGVNEENATHAHVARKAHAGTRLWFNLYFGERLSVENTYSVAGSEIAYDLLLANGTSHRVTGTMLMRQLTGGLRYDVFRQRSGSLRLYARAGYGWLSYRADAMRIDSTPLALAHVRGGHLPPLLPSRQWWPNTWYGGGGLEVFSPRRYYLLHMLGYGARIEYTHLLNKLTLDDVSDRGDVLARRGDVALSIVFGW
jgi:hypothetical protein